MSEIPPLVNHFYLPHINLTYPEFLNVILENTDVGDKLVHSEPRWIFGAKDERHFYNYTTDPEIIPPYYSGLKQDFKEVPLTDAYSPDHLLLTQRIARVILMDEKIKTDPKTFNLVCLLHDLHEGICGDKVEKTKEFKIYEHYLFQNVVIPQVVETYAKLLVEKGLHREIVAYHTNNFRETMHKVFLGLFAEEKLTNRYGATEEELNPIFGQGNVQARKNYKELSNLYEDTHKLTFLIAVLSCKDNSWENLALKYDVVQHFETPNFKFAHELVEHNREQIEWIKNILGEKAEIRQTIEAWGREFKTPNQINL